MEMKDTRAQVRTEVVIGLAMFVIAGAGSFLLWIDWIDERWITGTKHQKLVLWLCIAAFGLLWAVYSSLELRARKIGTPLAQWQSEVAGVIFGIVGFLIVSVGASFLIAVGLMILLGLDGSSVLATTIVMAMMVLSILVVYQYRRTRWRNTDGETSITHAVQIVLAPVVFFAFAGFISAFFAFAVMMGAAAFDGRDIGMSIDQNFGLSMGAVMLVMFAAIFALYLRRRNNTVDGRDGFATLSSAAGVVMYAAFIITFGGLAVLMVGAALKAHGVFG